MVTSARLLIAHITPRPAATTASPPPGTSSKPASVGLPKSALAIASATAVHRGAQWHEREAAEMFGIDFVGHPDPRNILLPDDWVGSPLRKDYEFPDEYHGISCK